MPSKTPWDEFSDGMIIDPIIGPPRGRFDGQLLAAVLKRKILGQDQVIEAFAQELERRFAQAQMAGAKIEKNLGVFLFAGPPASGKTSFAKVLAENFYDRKSKLIDLDMIQYRESYHLSSLVGSPQGYVGGPGFLTSALDQDPRRIVLLDGIEKAGNEACKLFLAAWSDGFLTDVRTGKRADITKALFLLTTNQAWERLVEIDTTLRDDQLARDVAIGETLKQTRILPELISRLDKVFVFHPLSPSSLARIADREIKSLAEQYNLEVARLDPHYVFEIVSAGRDRGINPRELSHVIDRDLGDLFVEAFQAGVKTVEVAFENGKPVVKIVPSTGASSATHPSP